MALTLFKLVCLLSVLVACTQAWGGGGSDWTEWSQCSSPCGNCGTQKSTRCPRACPASACNLGQQGGCYNSRQTRNCNRFCYNGGTQECGNCKCPPAWKDTCCKTPVLCSPPPNIADGYIDGTDYQYGSSVTYKCDTYYVLHGQATRTCTGSAPNWSGSTPSCVFSCPCQHEGTCTVPNSQYQCDCTAGWYGPLNDCKTAVTCPPPQVVSNGAYGPPPDDGSVYSYGSQVSLTCDPEYEVQGDVTRQCQTPPTSSSTGVWSGNPSCAFMNSCGSSPCLNNATCVDVPNYYQCLCAPGWTGLLCEDDFWPPEMANCPADSTLNTTQPTLYVSWAPPTMYDPHGFPVEVDTNYPDNSSTFPWGVFPVYYTATKTDNGMTVTCSFNISVYPTPCEPIHPPQNGAVACNAWNSEYGAVCMMFCSGDHGPAPGVSINQMIVCGASGRWSRQLGTGCDGNRNLQKDDDNYNSHFYAGNCTSAAQKESLQQAYIGGLRASSFSPMCTHWPGGCQAANVLIKCNLEQ